MSMTLANFPVRGASIGSYGTCIELPSLSMALDIGRCPESAVPLEPVLISHGHIDHVGGAAHHCARRQLKKLSPPTYVVPSTLVRAFRSYIQACRDMDGSRMLYNLVSADPDSLSGIKLDTLQDRYSLRTFWSHHRRPTVGYVLMEERKRLKPEFQGRPGPELGALRKQGVEFMEKFEHPVLAFTGDTRHSILDKVPELMEADLLIMEITFVDGQVTPDEAWRTGHTHLEHIRERSGQFKNKAVLFTHRSARHSPHEYRVAIETLPEPLLGKTKALLGRFPPSP